MSLIFAQYQFRDPTRFGEFSTVGNTTLNPFAVLLLVFAVGVIIIGKRRMAVLAGIALVMFVPSGQRLVIASIDFAFVRFVALAFALRLLLKSEGKVIQFGFVDALVGLICVWPMLAVLLRGGGPEFLTAVGLGSDRLLIYIGGRSLLRNSDDVIAVTRAMVKLALPIAGFFVLEKFTGRNLFAVFGGISPVTAVREGALRAQGAFAHPILAGAWWAAMIPLFLGLRWSPKRSMDRLYGSVGVVLAMLIIVMSASSTPFAGVAAGALVWALFRYRDRLGAVWTSLLGVGVALHFVHGPGLHHLLMAKFTFVSGSTGVHRYRLIDAAINRVGEWGLIGANTTYHWGWGLDDVTCQYVAAGLAGGLLQLTSLLLVLILTWRLVGKAIRGAKSSDAGVPYALGGSILVHAVCFLAVTYFGQIELLFWLTLGSTQTVCALAIDGQTAELRRDFPSLRWQSRSIGVSV